MPIVDIKGVGKAQFPDDMTPEQIKGFLRQKYPSEQALKSSVSLEPKPQTITPYEPTLAEKIGQGASDLLSDTGIISSPYRAQEIGRNLTGLGEFLPVLGDATAGDEFGRAVKEGDKFGMAMAGLGAVPVVGDVAKKGISKAKKIVDALDAEYRVAFAPLQAEYRAGVTPERKTEILKQAKELRQPLDAAKRNLYQLERDAAPKVERVLKEEVPNRTFKGKVYHQTAEDFDDFDFNKSADGTIWFTGDKKNFSDPSSSASAASGKAKILERDVELNKVAGFDELDKYSIGELQQQGYDGAVLDGDIQVFDPKAIKQATTEKAGNVLKGKFPDLKIGVSENADNIVLDKIIVPDEARGSGKGTEFMNELIKNADSKGKPIGLTPSADFGGSKAKLTKFYKKFGFVPNKGKNKDYTISETMIRQPQ